MRTLAPQLGIRDPQVVALVTCMEADVRAGCPGGTLFGESISQALAHYVIARYSSAKPRPAPRWARLSPIQRARVVEYIRCHLGDAVRLPDLCRVANLGPRQLSVAFRKTMGMTPHQYVTRVRIDEAKRLLKDRGLPLAEIALSLGFASQSHFTQVFRAVTGTTPKRYQRDV